jgi:hypothetical protein
MWFALLRRVGRGLAGRRFTVRDTGCTVVSLHGRPEGPRWSLGRARDVEVVLRDVTSPELDARELVVECETLTVGSSITATGVTLTATVTPESLGGLGAEDEPSTEVTVVDGEMRSPWLPGVEFVIEPEVTADGLRFVPVALITPLGRWSSTWWLPAGTAPTPDLPGGLRLAEIATTDDAVVLQMVMEEWTVPLRDGSRLGELLDAASNDRGTEPVAGPDIPAARSGGSSSRTTAGRATLER